MKIPSRIKRVEIKKRRLAREDDERAFLQLYRFRVENQYRDGTTSVLYNYDAVSRKWLDAVVLALTARVDDVVSVCLRACIRPPLLLREDLQPSTDGNPSGVLWELPAGLLEKGEGNPMGICRRAAIEAMEETGYQMDAVDFTVLPGAPFLSPGVMPERVHFAYAAISDISARDIPIGDGSPVEDDDGIWWVPVDRALDMCQGGEIQDAKTELCLHRLNQIVQTLGFVSNATTLSRQNLVDR